MKFLNAITDVLNYINILFIFQQEINSQISATVLLTYVLITKEEKIPNYKLSHLMLPCSGKKPTFGRTGVFLQSIGFAWDGIARHES